MKKFREFEEEMTGTGSVAGAGVNPDKTVPVHVKKKRRAGQQNALAVKLAKVLATHSFSTDNVAKIRQQHVDKFRLWVCRKERL